MIALHNNESKLKTQFQIQVTKKTLHPKGNLKKPDLAAVGGGGQQWERSSAARGPYGLNDVQCGGLGEGCEVSALMWGVVVGVDGVNL